MKISSWSLALAALFASTACFPSLAGAALPASLPTVTSGAPPGPDVLYSPAPAAPQLENRDPRFTAAPLLVSGTEAYAGGEYLYQDYLYDDYGSDTDGVGGLPQTARSSDVEYPTDRARYGNNAADLVELRIKVSPTEVAYRITLNTLLAADSTIVTIAFDTDRNVATGSATLPRDPGAPFPGTDEVITTWGTGAEHTRLSLLDPPVTTPIAVTGDVITKANAEKVRDLTSPGLYWCVQHGLPMRIVAPRKLAWPPAYREATEKYWAQVRLADDGLRLEGYVAGAPFPRIDPTDPRVATKLVWNYNYKSINNDDFDLHNFDADTGAIDDTRAMTVDRHFLIEHFRRLWYVNRLYVDPKPERAPNPEGAAYKETLHPLIEPFDLKGVGFLYYRYIDPGRQDDSWLYLPSLRRVRRLSTAQRSDALFGQDTDIDSYYGFSGQPAWSEWKYLGEKTILVVTHAEHFPVKWAEPPNDWAFDDVWEKADVYVVEGVSRLPQYAYSKRVLFIDKSIFAIPYSDMYDKAGELWKIWINDVNFAQKPFPGATVASYAYEVPFAPAITMIDMQLMHATRASLPSHRFPGEEGWYYNFGDAKGTNEEQFTIAELISSGH